MPYPDEFDTFREVENLPGLTYDAADKKTFFAEDFDALADGIANVQETLGLNPEGAQPTVSDRIAVIEAGAGGVAGDRPVFISETEPVYAGGTFLWVKISDDPPTLWVEDGA